MATLLICLIYLAFVSMGLPDSLLGSAWPSIYEGMNVSISAVGIVTILMSSGTVISSSLSDKVIRRFGTGRVTVFCTFLVAVSLFGFSFAKSLPALCIWAIPYGLGGGSIDAALNNYVALHYKSRHMSWIHFFWGIGAAVSPYIMSMILIRGHQWTSGYRIVGIIQTLMAVLLLLSLPIWKKSISAEEENKAAKLSFRQVLSLSGARQILIAFFCYCALETTAGLWAASYMTLHKGIDPNTAAAWASIFYLGITIGRFLSGFVSDRLGDRNMVRLGQGVVLLGIALLLLPLGQVGSFLGLMLIGLGDAPIYPCLLHETPVNFGKENSQAIIGKQMACAYIGSTLMPPVLGLLAQWFSISLYPVYLLLFAVIMIVMSEGVNAIVSSKSDEKSSIVDKHAEMAAKKQHKVLQRQKDAEQFAQHREAVVAALNDKSKSSMD